MFKQIKNNLIIYAIVTFWILIGIGTYLMASHQLSQAKTHKVPPEEVVELKPSDVESALKFATLDSLTVSSSSATLESSESAQPH